MKYQLIQSRTFVTGLFLIHLLLAFTSLLANPVFSNSVLNIYASEKHKDTVNAVAKPLSERINSLHQEIGIYPDSVADFIIVPDRESYQELARHKDKIVEYSDAFYAGSERRIYIRSPEQITDNYLKILMHEYIHWYVDYIFGTAPLWFHEGMAVQYSYQLGYERYYHFVRSRFWGDKLKLNDMYFEYPTQKADWNLFYLTSAFAIKYMRDEQAVEWKRFWDYAAKQKRLHPHENNKNTAAFSHAFYYAYTQSAITFAAGFDSYTRRVAIQYLFIGINGILFGMMPFFLILAYIKRRRKLSLLQEYPELEEIDEEEDDCPIPSETNEEEDVK